MIANANAEIEVINSLGLLLTTATDETFDDTGTGPVVKQWSLKHDELITDAWCSEFTIGSSGV